VQLRLDEYVRQSTEQHRLEVGMSSSERFWDKTAERYARSPVSDEATYQKKLAETQSFLRPEMRVVEFGCGTGTTAIHHAAHVQHVDAIDISEKMLDIGRGKARDANIDNITFTRGTLVEFNAAEASVDAVLGLNVIHLLPDREEVIAEVARILKPGGIFVSSTVCLGQSYLRFIKLVAPLGKTLGLMPDVYVLTEEELASEVTRAGFVIERQWHHGKGGIAVFIVARKL
jgi:2-polyprenyl-3-methyl-5-hydroxy-6-metoxy-1,4-benzoquinol methylase